MFENLMKIFSSTVDQETANGDVVFPSHQNNFISVKAVKSEQLSQFLLELNELTMKLDSLVVELYKSEEKEALREEYERTLRTLKQTQTHLKYLSQYFEGTHSIMQALKCRLIEDQKRVSELALKKAAARTKIRKLKKNFKIHRRRKNATSLEVPSIESMTFSMFRDTSDNDDVFSHFSPLVQREDDMHLD